MVVSTSRPVRRERGPTRLLGIAASVVVTLALAACSASRAAMDGEAPAGPAQSATSESAPAGLSSTTATTTTTTSAAPPATTEATTTTTAPATTTTEPTPLTPLPPSPGVEPIAPVPVPLSAVGDNSGDETARVQQRLLELGFWLDRADGDYGLTTEQAVMAFQKYLGLPTSGSVDDVTAASLSTIDVQAHGRADAGTLIEVDKARQLLFMVVDGRTQWVFNASTGSEVPYIELNQLDPLKLEEGSSITPDGMHMVNRERPQGWWAGDLGEIYRPKYFVGGVAVHGSNNVPDYPASHGCVRVTVQAMDFIWDRGLMPLRIPVWVHQRPPSA